MNLVEVKGVTKKFGDFTALNNIVLTINEGEVFGFIGPNGAGKSTTIRIMLGMLKATRGSVSLFGMDSWDDAVEIHKRISYVPGDVNLWPNLTGGEVIDLFLEMRGNGNKEKCEELIKRFDLDPTKKCRTYSKGNRQKIALIAAFASNADLFILDEPTSGLDPLMERVFQECVMEVKKSGKSVLLSSHILSEVEKLCDKVAIIRQGQIIETGSLKDLRHLTSMTLTVQTKKPIKDINKISGISSIRNNDDEVSFQIDNEKLDEVIKYISQFGIIKFESIPLTLEELFMRHYEKETPNLGGLE